MTKPTREECQELVRKFDDFSHWVRALILAGAVTNEDVDRMVDDFMTSTLDPRLTMPISELKLSTKNLVSLRDRRRDIQNVGQLITKSEEELLMSRNFGHTGQKEVKEVLADMGLSLGMMDVEVEVPGFIRERILSEARKLSEP
ncbi:MAG: DNA-directed RNA polymerase subunit alpha C-terminal domain-containing protein [Patescibacteria group bacterium]|jgi:DNA-directed RNA polymerase alpha subunit